MSPLAELLSAAHAAHQAGRLAEAVRGYRRALRAAPDHADALHLLGIALLQSGDAKEALAPLRRAARVSPQDAAIRLNLGNALAQAGRADEAVASYRQACELNPDLADGWFNIGTLLGRSGRHAEACDAFDRALAIHPQHAGYLNNRALSLKALGQSDAAETDLRAAARLAPGTAEAWENLADLLREQDRLMEAAAAYQRVLALAPRRADVAGLLYSTKREACQWDGLGDLERGLVEAVRQCARDSVPPVTPFTSLVMPLSPAQLRAIAEGHARRYERSARLRCPTSAPSRLGRAARPARLVVGYVSADFRDHPTAHLIAGLIEAHDRTRFEVRLYAQGPAADDAYRHRLVAGSDAFVDIAGAGVCEAAARIRRDGVHILLDLMGYTAAASPELFVLRPAPVQVSYLGFPGTMGAPWYDWYVTDPVCSPPGREDHFVERLVYMPHCYQPNDDRQAVARPGPSRRDCGLPDDGFVYCCFNQGFKIEPALFDVWARILDRVPGSVLWLFRKNPEVEPNLRLEAERRGLDPGRLVFAARARKEEHLARHRRADLFLDTLRYNAHTTASDALWAGLPVLTCPGSTFASRVGASLVHAVGLPELAVPDLSAYEETAVRLAQRPADLADLKARLDANRLTHALFDTRRYARDLERAFDAMWEAFSSGSRPASVRLS